MTAATSGDPSYQGIVVADVTVTNTHNTTSWVTVPPTTHPFPTRRSSDLTFTVVLNTQPAADVTIALTSSDTTEGTVSPATLTFTPVNWATENGRAASRESVEVAEGTITYTIVTAATSGDPGYQGIVVADVTVTNTDNATTGLTVTPTTGLTTTEAGGTPTFTVVLNTQPAADVTIALTSSDTTEGTVSPATLTFTPVNWATAQTVTVTGVNDAVVDGTITYTIVTAATSGDPSYQGIAVADVTVSNTDNDTAGVTVTPTSGLTTTEAGGTATFTVVLNKKPAADGT